jgi:hypothetical protein
MTVLIVVLSVFLIVFGVFFYFIYRWWQNYGKSLYNMAKTMGNLGRLTNNRPNTIDLQKQMKMMDDLMKKIRK